MRPATPGGSWRQKAVAQQPEIASAPRKPPDFESVLRGVLALIALVIGILFMIYLVTHASG